MNPETIVALSMIWAPIVLAFISLLGVVVSVVVQVVNARRIKEIGNGLKSALDKKTEEAAYATGMLRGTEQGMESGLGAVKIEDVGKIKGSEK